MQTIKFRVVSILNILATVFMIVACFCSRKVVFARETEFTISVKDKDYVLRGKELSYYKGRYYVNCLEGVVDGIYLDTLVAPVDASLKFCPEKPNPFELKKEVYGYGIDREKLIADIDGALSSGKTQVSATFVEIKPSVTESELKRFTYKRAEFSTAYPLSSSGRKHNISLATCKINGKVLLPGEEFSFNAVVGKRIEKNGFTAAPVIENGEFTEGVGGGVCQVSTTLYNCALLSGLKLTERHAHSLVPNYIEPSFDAMVSGEVFDLKFVNNTAGNIYIKGVTSGNSVTFTVYGEKLLERYQRVSTVLETVSPPAAEVVYDDTLSEGESEWIKIAKDGMKSQGYLVIEKQTGKKETVKLHTDNYKYVRGQVRVGNARIID